MFKVIHGQSPKTRSFIRYILSFPVLPIKQISLYIKIFLPNRIIKIFELQGGIFGKNCWKSWESFGKVNDRCWYWKATKFISKVRPGCSSVSRRKKDPVKNPNWLWSNLIKWLYFSIIPTSVHIQPRENVAGNVPTSDSSPQSTLTTTNENQPLFMWV